MTGRIEFTPEARQQLHQLDDWITEKVSAEAAQRHITAILDHVDGLVIFPRAGRARDDIRTGMRTTTLKKRTLIAYVVDESSGDLVVTVLGVFHGGRHWEPMLTEREGHPEAE